MIKKIAHRACESPFLSNLLRNVIEAGMITVRRNLRRELGDTQSLRLVDLACGTGEFARLARGDYVGVDLDARHVEYARRKHGSKQRLFRIADARETGLPEKDFDVTLVLSFLHHTADEDVGSLMREARRLARDKVILVDLVPLKYNLLGRFLYSLDQGNHIRPFERQLELVGRHADIQKSYVFRSGMDLHSFIVCPA